MVERVTLKDVYDVINNRLDIVEVKLDKRLSKAETKIDKIESFQDKTLGVLLVATFAFNVLKDSVMSFLTGKR